MSRYTTIFFLVTQLVQGAGCVGSNSAPTVLDPPLLDNEISIGVFPTTLQVSAEDAEGDDIHFNWNTPTDVVVSSENYMIGTETWVSQQEIDQDDRLIDTEIRCIVSDEDGAEVVVTWLVIDT